MDYFYDIALDQFVDASGSNRPLRKLAFMRDEDTVMEIRLQSNGAAYTPEGTALLTFAIKQSPGETAETLAIIESGDFTEDEGVYTGTLALNGESLSDLLGADFSITLYAQLSITDDDGTIKSRVIPVIMSNDIVRGTEGTPSALPDPDAYVRARAVVYDAAQSLTSPQQAQARTNIGLETIDYNELNNVPTEFPPSAHDHVVSDITPVSSQHLIGRHANGTGDAQEVTVSGGLEFSGSGIQIADTAVTAAEYTAPTITVDAKGRITEAESVTYETPAGADAKIAAAVEHIQAEMNRGPYADSEDAADNGVELYGKFSLTSGAVGWRQKLPAITIAAMGDSLSSGVELDATNPVESSYLWPVLAQTDRAIELVTADDGGNFQTGGLTPAQVRDTWLAQVITAAPDTCVVMVGTNGLADVTGTHRPDLDAAAAAHYSPIVDIIEGLRDAGIRPIICTITPDAFPTAASWPPVGAEYHPDMRTVRKKVNDLIRANAVSLGAVLCDWAGVISTDPDDDTALADTGYLFDFVHFYSSGSQQLGNFLRQVVQAQFSLGTPFAIPADDDPAWTTGNPYMSGSSSGKATGWDVFTTNCTTTNSKTAEGYQRIVCSDGADPGISSSFRLTRFLAASDDTFDGRSYRALLEFRPMEADFELWHGFVECAATNTSDNSGDRFSRCPNLFTSLERAEIGKIWVWNDKFFLLSPVVVHPGGAGSDQRRLTVTAQFYGRGTVDIRVCGILDVTP